MRVHRLAEEKEFDATRHVEKLLEVQESGDVSIACWEPGQISPYHCHPEATEIYMCIVGGGTMRTPLAAVAVTPGSLVVHPRGELHEYENGPGRSVLFRVRYGDDLLGREVGWRSNPRWRQRDDDARYFKQHPVPGRADMEATATGQGRTTK